MAFKKGNIPWNKGTKGIMEAWNKGLKRSQVAWNKGKKLSKEHRESIGISNIGQVAWNKGRREYKKICKGCGIEFETSRRDVKFHNKECYKLYNRGKNHHSYGIKHTEELKQKRREATIKQLSSGKMPNKKTSIEIALGEELDRVGVKYESNVALCNVGVVDFLLSDYDIIIQADGIYWHSSDKVKKRDATQDLVFSFNGYKVFRFWEDKIKESPKKCINKVLKYIKKKDKELMKIGDRFAS